MDAISEHKEQAAPTDNPTHRNFKPSSNNGTMNFERQSSMATSGS